jgi:hypothetical protein
MYQPVQGRLQYPGTELVVTVFLMTITYKEAKNISISTILFTLTYFFGIVTNSYNALCFGIS